VAMPPLRADTRTFSYVLGFSALLIFTVRLVLSVNGRLKGHYPLTAYSDVRRP
jgi:hypothetical protein